MTSTHLPQPPQGWKARLWRAPILFYRLGMGCIFGERFLLLTHTGRKSGLARQAVIEIVHSDPQSHTYYVVSGFGERAQWFQNIMMTPEVHIQVGNRKMSALAERSAVEEGERILLEYAGKHPTALRELTRLLNIPYDGSQDSIREMAKLLPVVAFYAKIENKRDDDIQGNQ